MENDTFYWFLNTVLVVMVEMPKESLDFLKVYSSFSAGPDRSRKLE